MTKQISGCLSRGSWWGQVGVITKGYKETLRLWIISVFDGGDHFMSVEYAAKTYQIVYLKYVQFILC